MSDFQEPIYHTNANADAGAPRWVGLAVAVLGGVSVSGMSGSPPPPLSPGIPPPRAGPLAGAGAGGVP